MEDTLNDFSFDQDLEIEDMDRFHGNDIFDNEMSEENTEEEKKTAPDGEPIEQSVAEETTEEKPKRGRPKKEEEVPVDMEMPEDSAGESQDDTYYTDLYNSFREIGIIGGDYDVQEGKNLTNDELIEILNKEKEESAKQIFKEQILDKVANDDDAKKFLEWKMKGGKTSEFFRVYGKNSGFDFNGNLDDENYQDTVIKKYLKERDGFSDDEIEDQLEMLEASGKKGKYAQKYHELMLREDEKEKSLLDERRKQEEEQERRVRERTNQMFAQAINSTESVFGVRMTKDRRSALYGSLTTPVEMPDGTVTTPFNHYLKQILSNPEKLVILADLVMNDLDVKKYSTGVRTEVTKEIRRNLNFNRTSSRSKPATRQTETEDWFN